MIHGNGWNDRFRSVESDIKFVGANQEHLIMSPDTRYNFPNELSFCVTFENISDLQCFVYQWSSTLNSLTVNSTSISFAITGGTILSLNYDTQIDTKINICFTWDGSNVYGYVNGELRGQIVDGAAPHSVNWGNNPFLYVGNRANLSNANNQGLSNLMFFNKCLSQNEVSYIHRTQLVPTSAHGDDGIVSHYPLTERYAYYNGVDKLFFDVIEQYNYAKTTPLTPIHLKAVNFTDNQLGINNGSGATSKNSFYRKDRIPKVGIEYTTANGHVFNNMTGNGWVLSENFTWLNKFIVLDDTATNVASLMGFGRNVNGLAIRYKPSTGQTILSSSAATFAIGNMGNVKRGNLVAISVTFDNVAPLSRIRIRNLTTGEESVFTGNVENAYNFSNLNTFFSGGQIAGQTSQNILNLEVGLYKNVNLSDVDIDNYFEKGIIPATPWLFWTLNNREFLTEMLDISGNGRHSTNLIGVQNDRQIEYNTFLKEIRQGLTITTGHSATANYIAITSLHVTLRTSAAIAAITDLITGLPAISATYVNGHLTGDVVSSINSANIVDIYFEFSSPFTGAINFVHTGVDYHLIRCGGMSELAISKHRHNTCNDTLLANPSLIEQQSYSSYHLWNSSDISAIPDNVGLLGSVTYSLSGWADQADVLANIVSINTLR